MPIVTKDLDLRKYNEEEIWSLLCLLFAQTWLTRRSVLFSLLDSPHERGDEMILAFTLLCRGGGWHKIFQITSDMGILCCMPLKPALERPPLNGGSVTKYWIVSLLRFFMEIARIFRQQLLWLMPFPLIYANTISAKMRDEWCPCSKKRCKKVTPIFNVFPCGPAAE